MAAANHTIKAVIPLATGLPLASFAMAHGPAMAHNGELHGQPEAAPPEALPPNTAGPDPIDSSATTSSDAAVESVSAADGSGSVSAASSLDSFPIGFSELLFGLIVIFPWLLIAFKKKLQLQRRS